MNREAIKAFHNPNPGWRGDDEELAPQFFGLS